VVPFSVASARVEVFGQGIQPMKPASRFTAQLTALASAAVCLLPAAGAPTPARDLDRWLDRQTNLTTWSAAVVQTRTLKTLSQPLVTPGRVWFQAPGQFRWELGQPARTVATRQANRLILLYPLLKRAELYPLGPESHGPWRDSLSLIEAGFPRSRADLEDRFDIVSVTTQASTLAIVLQPKTPSARRWLPRIRVTLNAADHALKSTELEFADGSRLLNEFSDIQVNLPLAADLFEPPIPQDYKVVEPGTR
jgi:outer membrane lipoprotein-sorting protein